MNMNKCGKRVCISGGRGKPLPPDPPPRESDEFKKSLETRWVSFFCLHDLCFFFIRHKWGKFINFEENPINKQSCWFNFLHPGETLQRGKLFAFILWKMHNRGMLNVGSSVETRKETFCSRVSCKKTFPDDELKERPLNDKATHVDLLLFWAKTIFIGKRFKLKRVDHRSLDQVFNVRSYE